MTGHFSLLINTFVDSFKGLSLFYGYKALVDHVTIPLANSVDMSVLSPDSRRNMTYYYHFSLMSLPLSAHGSVCPFVNAGPLLSKE